MKRTLFAAIALATVLAFGPGAGLADEQTQQAPGAAPPAAPAQNADKAVETTGGCMPGGGCCGQGACAHAAASAEKPAAGDATGGCPCSKAKQAQ